MTVKRTTFFCLMEGDEFVRLLKIMDENENREEYNIFRSADEKYVTPDNNVVITKNIGHLDNADHMIEVFNNYLFDHGCDEVSYRIVISYSDGTQKMEGYLNDPSFKFNILISSDTEKLSKIENVFNNKPRKSSRKEEVYTIILDEDSTKGLSVEYDPLVTGKLKLSFIAENNVSLGIEGAKTLRKALKSYIVLQEKFEKNYQ